MAEVRISLNGSGSKVKFKGTLTVRNGGKLADPENVVGGSDETNNVFVFGPLP